MTGNEIYHAALALTGEPPGSEGDYDAAVVTGLLNILLSECLPYNNVLREAGGGKPMEETPVLLALTDPPGYEPVMEREVLPYGLAMHLMLSDDEMAKAQFFNQKYEFARERASLAAPGVVRDVYGG